MSTEQNRGKRKRILLLPLLTAAPIILAMLFAYFRWGPVIRKLISILIKVVVTG